MAKFNSKVSVFQINDGSLRDLSQYISEISGLPGERQLNEVTALGDDGRKYIPGLENAQITLRGHFDDTTTTGPDAVLGGLRASQTTAAAWDYGPKGSTGGFVKYSGNAWVQTYNLTSRVGEIVGWECTLQVDGGVTRGTY